jgi:hypothetical protein
MGDIMDDAPLLEVKDNPSVESKLDPPTDLFDTERDALFGHKLRDLDKDGRMICLLRTVKIRNEEYNNPFRVNESFVGWENA